MTLSPAIFKDTDIKAQIEIARQVDVLVRDLKVMQWFQDMVAEYVRQEVEYFELKTKAKAELAASCQAILDNERLGDETAGPPGDGWEWRRESNFGTQYQPVVGWFPPATIEVPYYPWPWNEDARRQDPSPFTRATYLPAKCYLLAACHDRHVTANPRILTENMIQGYPPLEVLTARLQPASNREHTDTLDTLETELAAAFADVEQEVANLPRNNQRKQKTRRSRKPGPQQMYKEARELSLAKLIAGKPEITCSELAEQLECDKSTITRSKAWQNRYVVQYEGPSNGTKASPDSDDPHIEAEDYREEDPAEQELD